MRQQVPAEVTGAAGVYRMQRGVANALFGGDFTRVEGYSVETSFPTGFSNKGGVQWHFPDPPNYYIFSCAEAVITAQTVCDP